MYRYLKDKPSRPVVRAQRRVLLEKSNFTYKIEYMN